MAPVTLPNALIYLTSLVRPKLLRPDLKVPSIAHLDFQALRREGYNAVVIDKDNCLTLPNKDDIYPPYQTAWNDLLETFRPGRVLVVSNSAGTKKDPGGIAAESVSLSLRAPVLLHNQPKPGCSRSIVQYFTGQLGEPMTRRKEIRESAKQVWREEKEDEQALWARWEGEVDGPLLGHLGANHHLSRTKGREGDKAATLEKRVLRGAAAEIDATAGPGAISKSKSEPKTLRSGHGNEDDLRILVIGDRLFTDALLAHRLSLYLPKPKPKLAPTSNSAVSSEAVGSPLPATLLPSVLSVHTTALPQPKDVRLLRWLEERLTRGQLRVRPNLDLETGSKIEGRLDLSRFVLPDPETTELAASSSHGQQSKKKKLLLSGRLAWARWLTPARWRELDSATPPLTYHPRSWRPLPITIGLAKTLSRTAGSIFRFSRRGVKVSWSRGKEWVNERRRRRLVEPPVSDSLGPGLGQRETSAVLDTVREKTRESKRSRTHSRASIA
ncbi:hypothetical protein IAU59_004472 [Kwoniella sp. CBS 9459]